MSVIMDVMHQTFPAICSSVSVDQISIAADSFMACKHSLQGPHAATARHFYTYSIGSTQRQVENMLAGICRKALVQTTAIVHAQQQHVNTTQFKVSLLIEAREVCFRWASLSGMTDVFRCFHQDVRRVVASLNVGSECQSCERRWVSRARCMKNH